MNAGPGFRDVLAGLLEPGAALAAGAVELIGDESMFADCVATLTAPYSDAVWPRGSFARPTRPAASDHGLSARRSSRVRRSASCAFVVLPVSDRGGARCSGAALDTLRLRAVLSPTTALIGRWCDSGPMTAWQDVERAEPEFAQRVRELFDAHRHKTVATLRGDGSPRISGIEATFEDGELSFGSMPNARKGADLRRDPRFALHSATVDPGEGSEAQWPGEAKISGRATQAWATTEGPDGDLFRADITEVVHTHLNVEATRLVVEWWTPTQGLRRIERE